MPNNSTIKNLQSIGSMPMNHIWGPLVREEGPYIYKYLRALKHSNAW